MGKRRILSNKQNDNILRMLIKKKACTKYIGSIHLINDKQSQSPIYLFYNHLMKLSRIRDQLSQKRLLRHE